VLADEMRIRKKVGYLEGLVGRFVADIKNG